MCLSSSHSSNTQAGHLVISQKQSTTTFLWRQRKFISVSGSHTLTALLRSISLYCSCPSAELSAPVAPWCLHCTPETLFSSFPLLWIKTLRDVRKNIAKHGPLAALISLQWCNMWWRGCGISRHSPATFAVFGWICENLLSDCRPHSFKRQRDGCTAGCSRSVWRARRKDCGVEQQEVSPSASHTHTQKTFPTVFRVREEKWIKTFWYLQLMSNVSNSQLITSTT